MLLPITLNSDIVIVPDTSSQGEVSRFCGGDGNNSSKEGKGLMSSGGSMGGVVNRGILCPWTGFIVTREIKVDNKIVFRFASIDLRIKKLDFLFTLVFGCFWFR